MTRLRDSGLENSPSLREETRQTLHASSSAFRQATGGAPSPTARVSSIVTSPHDDDHAEAEQQEHSFSLLENLAPHAVLDTLPPFPSSVLPEDPATAKYFAYLPHSGL